MNPEHQIPQFLLRSWPFPRGAGRIVDRLFSRLVFSKTTATVATTDGFPIDILPNDLIGRHIYLTGEFDRSIVEVLLGLARPGDALLDIGANIGYVSCCFLAKIPHSFVNAVEPQPIVVDLLRSNLSSFGQSRSRVFQAALSDGDTLGWLRIAEHNLGASRLVTAQTKCSIQVQCMSAERLFSSIEKIDIVKIDVEGHEATILKSCQQKIDERRPRAILFEDTTKSAAPDGAIGRLFSEIDYEVVSIKKHLTRLEFVKILDPSDCSGIDYLARPR